MLHTDDLPSFRFGSRETLSPNNLLDAKGAAKNGSIIAPTPVARVDSGGARLPECQWKSDFRNLAAASL